MAQCNRCKGKGEIPNYRHNHGGLCFACKGTGQVADRPARTRKVKTPERPTGPVACTICYRWVDQVMGVWYGVTFYCGDCEAEVHKMILARRDQELYAAGKIKECP